MTRPAGTAVSLLAARGIWRPALVVTGVTVGMSVLVVATYARTFGEGVDASALEALARNPAIRTLFGEPVALDTAGGFTVWRTGTVLAVLVSVWSLLATVRMTRGEEEAGRWGLLLAGRLTPAAVLRRHLAPLTATSAVAGSLLAVALTAAGTPWEGALLHGAGLASAGAFAVAVGAVVVQIHSGRAAAAGSGLAVLGAGLLARMAGDSGPAAAWLRWLPPYGPLALTRPYHENRWAPLLVSLAAVVLLTGTALALCARRDVGAGLLRPPSGRAPRSRLLRSVPAFAMRRALRPLAGWATGIGAYFLLIGVLATSLTGFLAQNPAFADLAARAGFGGLDRVHGYVATLFALLAVPIGGFATARLNAFVAAEVTGRLTLLRAGPVSRARLLAAEVGSASAGAVALALAAGLATWLGTVLVGAGLPLGAALAGTLNVLPLVLLGAGAATLAVGAAPRLVPVLGMLPTAGGFLLTVVTESVRAPGWIGALSPYAHLAAVPDAAPNWTAQGVLVAAAFALAALGGWAYGRRDLAG
ncbi:ABC transporter permease [Micromonospora tulbaghiae]